MIENTYAVDTIDVNLKMPALDGKHVIHLLVIIPPVKPYREPSGLNIDLESL